MSDGPPRALAVLIVLGAAALAACRGEPLPAPGSAPASAPGSASASASAPAHHPGAAIWFEGPPEQAFAAAKERGLPVFVYWGAAWCPPCNELAAEVFEHPRFPELVRGFIPLHLDGDAEDAQAWADRLGISAYPTVLVLGPDREERLRLNGAVDLGEMERALRAAMAGGQSFEAAARRLDEGRASPEDLRLLAFAAWELLPEPAWTPARRLAALSKAAARCPPALARERAMLAANALSFALAGRSDPALTAPVREIRAAAPALLDAIFADREAQRAARTFIAMRAGDLLAWLHDDARDAPGADEEPLRRRWLDAADAIGADETASIEARLWSVRPALEIAQRGRPQGEVPEAVRARVERAAEEAVTRARRPSERHAVISGAAYLLRRLGAHDRARALLIAEAERTDTPWYYFSTLVALEQELGRAEEARRWSARARESAAGRATRLQWIANDIALAAEGTGPEARAYLLGLADQYYQLATQLADGFSGRNRARAEQIARALAPLRGDPGLIALVERHRGRCAALPEARREACARHFEALR